MKGLFYFKIAFSMALLYGVQMSYAQPFAPKDQYLIDSLDFASIDSTERLALDSCLAVYHQEKGITARYATIAYLIEERLSFDVKNRYNQWLCASIEQVLKTNSSLPPADVNELKKILVDATILLGDKYRVRNAAQKSIPYYEKALVSSTQLGYIKGIAYAKNQMGLAYVNIGKPQKAKLYYEAALAKYTEINDKNGMASTYGNLSSIYADWGDIPVATDYLTKSLKLKEETGNLRGQSIALNNLSAIFYNQHDDEKALEYLNKALAIDKQLGNEEDIAYSYNNLGAIYHNRQDYRSAIASFRAAMAIFAKNNDEWGVAMCLNNLGGNLYKIDSVDAGMACLYRSLEIFERIDNSTWLAFTYNKLATLNWQQGITEKALLYGEKALALSDKIGHIDNIKRATNTLQMAYEKTGRFEEALQMYRRHVAMSDSLESSSNQRAVIQMETKYEYEKQKVLDDAENEKLLAIEKQKQHQQFIVMVFTISGSAIITILLLIIYRRLKLTRKQKIIIEEQKEEVESQRDQIENQKNIIEHAHSEVISSITYAKRIQEAILPSLTDIEQALPQSFVFYLPKDVVAGDFYWMEQIGHKVYIAAADCTGHGVPGAMVSVVCSNALNKALLEDSLTDVGKILDRTRHIVIDKLAKSSDVKDGMDISLACIDRTTQQLEWAGANNPLYLLRHTTPNRDEGESLSLEIIKGDRESIGYTQDPTAFTTHRLQLQQNDMVYLFTDGFADQFGGDDGKKLGYAKFRETLIAISNQPMQEQKELLSTYFTEWKGNEEQVDDVCIVGIRV